MQASPLATPLPWNLVAPAYADELLPMMEAYAHDALRLAAPPFESRVIDVACGPGTLSMLAAKQGLRVDAIDFSQAMLDQFVARLDEHPLPTISLQLADGQALPFDDGIFAAGFSMLGLMFFPDRAKGFAELRRVLAPGARAVVSSWPPIDEVPAMGAMFGALREAMGKLLGAAQPAPEMPLSTEDACRAEMSVAFANVEVHRVAHVQHYASAAALWSTLERSFAPIVLMRHALGDRWSPLADAARTAIARAVGDGPIDQPMTALLTVGTAR